MGEDRTGAERNLDSRLEKKRGEGREDSRGRRESNDEENVVFKVF